MSYILRARARTRPAAAAVAKVNQSSSQSVRDPGQYRRDVSDRTSCPLPRLWVSYILERYTWYMTNTILNIIVTLQYYASVDTHVTRALHAFVRLVVHIIILLHLNY